MTAAGGEKAREHGSRIITALERAWAAIRARHTEVPNAVIMTGGQQSEEEEDGQGEDKLKKRGGRRVAVECTCQRPRKLHMTPHADRGRPGDLRPVRRAVRGARRQRPERGRGELTIALQPGLRLTNSNVIHSFLWITFADNVTHLLLMAPS